MAPRVVDKAAKKEYILQAAMKVFAQQGFGKTKMIDIATEAGIGKGTIYEYFSSKDEIFSNAYTYFIQGLEQEFTKAITETEDPADKIIAIINATVEGIVASADFVAIMLDFWAEGIRNHNHDEMNQLLDMKKMYSTYRTILVQIIEEGIAKGVFRKVDPISAASIIIGALDGIMLQWYMEPDLIEMDKITETLISMFKAALKS